MHGQQNMKYKINGMFGHNKSVAFFWKPTPHQTNNTVSLQT